MPLCGFFLFIFSYSTGIQTQCLGAKPQSLLLAQTSGFKMVVMPEFKECVYHDLVHTSNKESLRLCS